MTVRFLLAQKIFLGPRHHRSDLRVIGRVDDAGLRPRTWQGNQVGRIRRHDDDQETFASSESGRLPVK
jgi:hypothetical protein